VEFEEREAEETHPDEPSGNGEPPTEPYEPQRADASPDKSAESKPTDDSDEQAERASDDGMARRTHRRQ
jgi:hypothetical protein